MYLRPKISYTTAPMLSLMSGTSIGPTVIKKIAPLLKNFKSRKLLGYFNGNLLLTSAQ